jgi:DNA excision repair protein ERCC-3
MFTAEFKQTLPPPTEACILLTTYTMICYSGQRAEGADEIMKAVVSREWGLMLLDEVHVAPAKKFRKVLDLVSAHCKIGLTATLVREDALIGDLNILVGPKLYEANWMDLTQQGYLANVQCVEVWCHMTPEFYAKYLDESLSMRTQQLLYILNPTKFRACEFLMKYHEARGDKVIIFSDDVCALELYCRALERPFIHGGTPDTERSGNLLAFKTNPLVNCLGLSKVGDTALDIPEANVIIQVASHFGARRQEAQRLGRILRPKANMKTTSGFNAFFYTLVSTDTREMFYSAKRQQYLIDQGYTFKVVQDLMKLSDKESTLLRTKTQEISILNDVLKKDTSELDNIEEKAYRRNINDDFEKPSHGHTAHMKVDENNAKPKRKTGNLSSLSGAGGSRYMVLDAASSLHS